MSKSVERQCYEALVVMVDRYTELVSSGDAGHWNPEADKAYRGRQFAGRAGHSADRREA